MTKQTGSIDLKASKKLGEIATDTAQYFWFSSGGSDNGAHVTQVDKATFQSNPSGGNTLITSNGFAVRDGLDELATFVSSGAVIGKIANGKARSEISTNGMRIIQRTNNYDTLIAHLGFGEGHDEGGSMSDAPYFSFGYRDGDIGIYSTSEGFGSEASGPYTHAEGYGTKASGYYSHSEGRTSIASAMYAHAEGDTTEASGLASHAEGSYSVASASYSHAEGKGATASGFASHAQNSGTIASRRSQTAIGEYNIEDTAGTSGGTLGDYAFIIGNGTDKNARSNAFTVKWDGETEAKGFLKSTKNGNTVTIGSQNSSWCHIYNSANVPFILNKGLSTTGGDLGTASYKWGNLYLSGNAQIDGTIETKYVDLHASSGGATDYDCRLTTNAGSNTGEGFLHINNQPMKDFVIERGVSSSWYYRKWNSGKVEAWRMYNAGSQTPSKWTDYMYYKDLDIAIPSGIFSATPNSTVATCNGSDYQFMVFVARATSATNIRVRVCKPNAGAATPVIALYVSNMV